MVALIDVRGGSQWFGFSPRGAKDCGDQRAPITLFISALLVPLSTLLKPSISCSKKHLHHTIPLSKLPVKARTSKPSEAPADFTSNTLWGLGGSNEGATHPSLLLSSGDKLIDLPSIHRAATVLKQYEDKGRAFANLIIIQFVLQINKEI